jgi:hypothetical protein
MTYDLEPYTRMSWRDSTLLTVTAGLFFVFGISLAVQGYGTIVSQPLQPSILLREIVIVVGIAGGAYTLGVIGVSVTLREGEVTPRGIRLRWKSGKSAEILWGQGILRVLDDSRIKRFAAISKDDARSLLRYRMVYRRRLLTITSPVPEGMVRDILSMARRDGRVVGERVVLAGPKVKEIVYTV